MTAMFLGYRAYRLYMSINHPTGAVLSYRDWLDFGHREK